MPAYKNRPSLNPQTQLRRYMSLEAVLRTLGDSQLRLTRTDTFEDPFEGSVPKQQIDDQITQLSNSDIFFTESGEADVPLQLDPWTEMTRRRRTKTRSAHASCWSSGPESEAMWRLYCSDEGEQGQGVAIESTLARVELSVAQLDLFVSPVIYRYFHEGPPFDDELDSHFHKRLGFRHEAEVRFLKYDHAYYMRHDEAIANGTPEPDALPVHLSLDWPCAASIDRILVSPYATPEYETRVRNALATLNPSLAVQVDLSLMSERRHAPGF